MFKDYYKLLAVDRDASHEEIKEAFRSLAKLYHPDSTNDRRLHKKFLKINEAYQVLGDPLRRARYNLRYIQYMDIDDEDGSQTFDPYFYDEPVLEKKKRRPLTKEERFERWLLVCRIAAGICFIFGMSMVMDFILSEPTMLQTMLEGSMNSLPDGSQHCTVKTQDYEFEVDYSCFEKLGKGDQMTLFITPIYGIISHLRVKQYAHVNQNGEVLFHQVDNHEPEDISIKEVTFTLAPRSGIYNVFSFFLVALLINSIAVFAVRKRPEWVVKLCISMVLLAFSSFYILLQS